MNAKIQTWKSPTGRFVIAPCKAEIFALMVLFLSASNPQGFTAGRSVPRVHPNLSIALSSARLRPRRMPDFAHVFVAGQKLLLTWRHGVELPTQCLAPWLLSLQDGWMEERTAFQCWPTGWV